MAHEKINWFRILAEAIAIVFSILLAFGIDAAWDLRGDRRREESYLRRLRIEFQDNRQDLLDDRTDRDRIIADFAFVLGASADPDRAIPAEIGRRLQNLSGNFRFYSPAQAVLNELISSGDLGLLRSDSLRHALLRYDEVRQRLAGVEESEQAIQRLVVVPYLAEHMEVLPWIPDDQKAALGIAPRAHQDPRSWLTDAAFQNMILLRWQRSGVVQRYSDPVLAEVNRILVILDEQVGPVDRRVR